MIKPASDHPICPRCENAEKPAFRLGEYAAVEILTPLEEEMKVKPREWSRVQIWECDSTPPCLDEVTGQPLGFIIEHGRRIPVRSKAAKKR